MLVTYVESGIKYLSEVDFESLSLYWPYLTFLSFLILFHSIYYNRDCINVLDDLKIAKDGKKLNIKKCSQFLEFRNVKTSALSTSFWMDKLESIGITYNAKFIDVRFISGFRPRVQLYYDSLPTIVPYALSPDLLPMQTWLGKNQFADDVIINLQDTPAIYLDGKPGSGKTQALLAILNGFMKGIQSQVEVTIVTTKTLDFFTLRKNPRIILNLIDPFNDDYVGQLKMITETFNPIKVAEESLKEAVNNMENDDVPEINLESFRQKGICEDTPRRFYIFDEAKDYLSKNKADTKEEAEAKLNLVTAVYTHIRRTARFLSMPIIIASQTQNEGDLDIPLKMFHLRIASSTNEAMSRLITGDKRLTDLSYTKGKFFLKTDKEEHIVRFPYRD